MTTLLLDPRPAYEFVLSLVVYSTPERVDSYEVGREWFARTDERIPASLRERIRTLARGCDHVLTRLLGVAFDLPQPGTADALVARLEAIAPEQVRLTLLGYYARRTRRRVDPELIVAAAHGDASAARVVIAATADGPECERAIAGVLGLSDAGAADVVVGIARDWLAGVWPDHLAHVGPILEAEVERLRDRSRALPLRAFLDEITNGADIVTGPGLDEIEVYPTWVIRPWNVFWEHGSSLLLGVAVASGDAVGDPDEPPERLVHLARALGDERRLRLLRRLTTGDYSLQQLSEHFGIPKTTLLHHLVILRSAGIVRVTAEANPRYSLQPGMPLELQRMLERYLPAVRREPLPAGVDPRAAGR